LTDFFQKYLPGTLAKSLVGHASFTAGKVIVSGVTLTQTQHDDLVKVFKDKFLSFFSQNETHNSVALKRVLSRAVESI